MSALPRVLEPEVMDSAEDAREYDAMDHAAVNDVFVTDLIQALTNRPLSGSEIGRSQLPDLNILDLGAGTAQIPIELARRVPNARITAFDAAASMIALAKQNVAAAQLTDRIICRLADAKKLPFESATFGAVISNSILHHIPSPRDVVAESVRVTAPGWLLFHRDLCRPADEAELTHIVETYAAEATDYQRRLFSDSLHAALTVEEVQQLVAEFGFTPETVRKTSDRHWTWIGAKH
jgi:ubiquinone/menaquinone biosynthesis C-methylase UbiE